MAMRSPCIGRQEAAQGGMPLTAFRVSVECSAGRRLPVTRSGGMSVIRTEYVLALGLYDRIARFDIVSDSAAK
jgi:hypothetical protein